METERNYLQKQNQMMVTKMIIIPKKKKEKKINCDLEKIYYIFIVLFILFICIIISINIKNNISLKIIKITNETNTFKKDKTYNDTLCLLVKNKLQTRTYPLDFANELIFFTQLIECQIPFSFIRFGDGESIIMKGEKIHSGQDSWNWNPDNKKFRESLIKASSICINDNNFIGLPCKNWIHVSKSILSFSNCTSSKYMTFATLFINKNFEYFKEWIIRFINSSNRWKIILVANSIINKNITWAYKFYPVPDHIVENFDNISISLLPELSNLAKQNNFIFFVSAGPAANIIISYLVEINRNNIYIDIGSSIEFITKGYSTRYYDKNGGESKKGCESFIVENKKITYMR